MPQPSLKDEELRETVRATGGLDCWFGIPRPRLGIQDGFKIPRRTEMLLLFLLFKTDVIVGGKVSPHNDSQRHYFNNSSAKSFILSPNLFFFIYDFSPVASCGITAKTISLCRKKN